MNFSVVLNVILCVFLYQGYLKLEMIEDSRKYCQEEYAKLLEKEKLWKQDQDKR